MARIKIPMIKRILVGLFAGLITVVCFAHYGFGDLNAALKALVSFAIAMILICIAVIDIDRMEIPDELLIVLIVPAIVSIFVFQNISMIERVIGAFCVALPLYLLNFVIKDAFGGGDIKLYFVCGFILGWKNTLLSMAVAFLIGGGYATICLLAKKIKRKQHIAFGQYICIGVYLSLLFGEEILVCLKM